MPRVASHHHTSHRSTSLRAMLAGGCLALVTACSAVAAEPAVAEWRLGLGKSLWMATVLGR